MALTYVVGSRRTQRLLTSGNLLDGDGTAAEVEEGMAVGAIGYLLKPFDVNTLGKQVYALLASKKG